MSEPANLLGGRWEAAADGRTFRVHPRRAPFGPPETWPRSGAEDALWAVGAAREAAAGWSELPRGARRERLVVLADRLEARGDLADLLARALGLEEDELAARHAEELFRLREGLELLAEGVDCPGAGVFQAHWSDFAGGLAARLAARLVAGATAVVVADPALPHAPLALARAAREAELPAGVVNVLFDDVGAALREALGFPGLAWARLRGPWRALKRLRQHTGPFPAQWRVWPVTNATHRIAEDADPAAEAALVLEKAIARSSTLSGQLPGQVGRVVCHQRLFSRFSEELLRSLEAAPDARRPVPAIDGDLPEHVRRAWALGLDEGATPIFGGEPPGRPAAPAGEPDGEPGGRAPRAVPPVVFTNVEPGQRLARLGRPAPVLTLIRAASDEAARELARKLDEAVAASGSP